MATRAYVQEQNVIVIRCLVPPTKAVTKGQAVIFSGADDQVENAGADSDLAIGVAKQSGVPGDWVDVALFAYAVTEALAGTGGVTRGNKQVLVANGFTNAPADNGATTPKPTYGFALQTAAVGERFSLAMSGPANRTTT